MRVLQLARRMWRRLSRLQLVRLVFGLAELSAPSQLFAAPSLVPSSPPNASSEPTSFPRKLPSLLTSDSCNVMLRDPKRIFLSMWSPVATGWLGRGSGDATCFGKGEEADRFFDDTLDGTDCHQNWHAGHHEWPRYPFGSKAPALLGYGGASMMQYCLDVSGNRRKVDWFPSQQEVANACINASQNILRINGWTMCLNLKWMVCAARGLLPDQKGKEMRFTHAPKSLRIDGDYSPAREGGAGGQIIEEDVQACSLQPQRVPSPPIHQAIR